MGLHLFELEGVLALFFISSFLVLPTLLVLVDRLLQLDEVLLLVLHAPLVLALKVVKLSYFVGYSGLAFPLS
jgi:hypothetical protein